MTRKTRWGILGPGKIAESFVEDFSHTSNNEVVAVASRSIARARTFAEKFRIPQVLGTYEELYESQEVDIIYIATPHNFHFTQSKAALLAGKSVLCEKPITTNVADAEELFQLSRDKRLYLMEAMWMYFLPAIRKAKEWVNQGRIGQVRSIKSDFGFPVPFDPAGRMYNPDLAGGALLDMGIYPIAMANYFLGADPTQVDVQFRKAATGVDSDVCVLLQYPRATAMLHTSFECRLPNLTQIIGDTGTLVVPDFWGAKEVSLVVDGSIVETFVDRNPGRGYNFEIMAVSDDLGAGKYQSDVVSHEVSLTFQRLIQRISTQFSREQ